MNERTRRIGKNVVYNLILQSATWILPLLLTPYLARVLGADEIGVYSYTFSIVQYFVLLGTLGTTIYGTRQIAYARDNPQRLSRTFWSLVVLRLILTGVVLTIYIVLFNVLQTQYKLCFLLQAVVLVANMVDISWLFTGLEDFKKIVLRSLAVKLAGFILVFIVIRSSADTWKYVLVQGGTLLIGNLVLWFYLPESLKRSKVDWRAVFDHLSPAFSLFIPQAAINIYAQFDKTMLGMLSTTAQVGYYAKAEQFAKLPLALLAVLSTVMTPVMSDLHEKKNTREIRTYLDFNLQTILCFGIATAFGVAGIAKRFIPWMLGEGFQESALLLVVLAPLTIIIGLSNVIGRQYLIPTDHVKQLTISVTCGACINFAANLLLIPRWNALGACIATLFAEAAVTAIQILYTRRELNAGPLLKCTVKYLFAGALMWVVITVIGNPLGSVVSTTLLQIIAGLSAYLAVLLVMKDRLMMKMLGYAKHRIFKR